MVIRVGLLGCGHVGSALVPELLQHGHSVIGLARSDAAAARLTGWGAEVVRGDLDDIGGLRTAARAADGVVADAGYECLGIAPLEGAEAPRWFSVHRRSAEESGRRGSSPC